MYITSDFDIKNTPKTPEYSQLENWPHKITDDRARADD